MSGREVLPRFGARKGCDPGTPRDLAGDTLIALSAREAGARRITGNRGGFAGIGQRLALRVIFW